MGPSNKDWRTLERAASEFQRSLTGMLQQSEWLNEMGRIQAELAESVAWQDWQESIDAVSPLLDLRKLPLPDIDMHPLPRIDLWSLPPSRDDTVVDELAKLRAENRELRERVAKIDLRTERMARHFDPEPREGPDEEPIE